MQKIACGDLEMIKVLVVTWAIIISNTFIVLRDFEDIEI